jgi:hypothetical protein
MAYQLDRNIPFVDSVFRIIEGVGSEEEAVHILAEAEQRYEVYLIQPPLEGTPARLPDALYSTAIEGSFFVFMAETHLLFSPTWYYDNLTLVLPGGYTWDATHRAWGDRLADWANMFCWCARDDWDYVPFYLGYIIDMIADFEAWQEVAWRIVGLKSHLYPYRPAHKIAASVEALQERP